MGEVKSSILVNWLIRAWLVSVAFVDFFLIRARPRKESTA